MLWARKSAASGLPRYPEIRMMPLLTATLLGLALAAPQASAQTKEIPMHHAHGTFTVDVHPLTPAPAEGLSRFSIDKQIHGGLEATSKGEMFGAGEYTKGAAGYVAIEMVSGTLDGKHGSFALIHLTTMDANGPRMQVIIAPGSGTGELKGIAGTFTIKIENGQHFYDFDYTLP
jgi:hypothetical protein